MLVLVDENDIKSIFWIDDFSDIGYRGGPKTGIGDQVVSSETKVSRRGEGCLRGGGGRLLLPYLRSPDHTWSPQGDDLFLGDLSQTQRRPFGLGGPP